MVTFRQLSYFVCIQDEAVDLKSVQSALTHLQRLPEIFYPNAIMGLCSHLDGTLSKTKLRLSLPKRSKHCLLLINY